MPVRTIVLISGRLSYESPYLPRNPRRGTSGTEASQSDGCGNRFGSRVQNYLSAKARPVCAPRTARPDEPPLARRARLFWETAVHRCGHGECAIPCAVYQSASSVHQGGERPIRYQLGLPRCDTSADDVGSFEPATGLRGVGGGETVTLPKITRAEAMARASSQEFLRVNKMGIGVHFILVKCEEKNCHYDGCEGWKWE